MRKRPYVVTFACRERFICEGNNIYKESPTINRGATTGAFMEIDRATARVAPTLDEATDKRPAIPARPEKTGDSATARSASSRRRASWAKWYGALKSVLPIYIGIHLAFFVTSFLSVLFVLSDFSKQSLPIYTLWQAWHRWDTGNFLVVA